MATRLIDTLPPPAIHGIFLAPGCLMQRTPPLASIRSVCLGVNVMPMRKKRLLREGFGFCMWACMYLPAVLLPAETFNLYLNVREGLVLDHRGGCFAPYPLQ
jgi:hypothetical protein